LNLAVVDLAMKRQEYQAKKALEAQFEGGSPMQSETVLY
jgi:hypothetical protein